MSYLTPKKLAEIWRWCETRASTLQWMQAETIVPEILSLSELRALLDEVQAARQLLHDVEAIRCNSEENTYGVGFCDLPEETQPHSSSDHLKAQLRAINTATRAALTAYQQGKENG